jgi:hypothetical protein
MSTEPRSESSGAKRIFWGCLGVVGITFVVLLLGGGIWYAAATSQARSELAKEVKLLRDRGAPLTTIDLHEQYQAEFQNPPYGAALLQALAAGTNQEMAELAKPLPIVGLGPEVPPLGQPWPQQADAEHYLAQNQKLLELLEQLSKDPVRIHFTSDLRLGFHGSLDSLQSTRYGARVLSLQFQVDLRHGRTAQAIGRIEQQIAISEAMREEPFLVGQLVRCALVGVAIQDLQYLVEHVELSDAELARVQIALRRPDLLHSLRKALDSEAASIYTLSTWPRDAMVDGGKLTVDEVTTLANQPPRRPADVAMMLSFFRRMLKASETSLAAAQAEGKQIETETKQLAGSNARMFYMDSISLGPTLGPRRTPSCERLLACKVRTQRLRLSVIARPINNGLPVCSKWCPPSCRKCPWIRTMARNC